uniref:Lysosome-associated membrane glycoprotein 1 n=1 Tax=Haemonchus contortus TaxID=6289 RepID=A0A7I4Y202_HAECO
MLQPAVLNKSLRSFLIILVVDIGFNKCQHLSMVVESFNLRSEQTTHLTCSRIREILLNKKLLKDWHCIGGTKAASREPGMWIMATSPLIKVEEKKVPFEIAYDEVIISTIFELEDKVNQQLTSTATMHLQRENSNLNATMTYIQFRTDETARCSEGISAGVVVSIIEGLMLAAIGVCAALQYYRKKRHPIHSVFGREGAENLGNDNEE